MKKVLSLLSESHQENLNLEKEKIIIGTDENCDLVISGEEYSRKHIAVINKFGSLYVENLSSSGTLLKNGDPVEYTEFEENDSIQFGNYSLNWKSEEGDIAQEVSTDESGEQEVYESSDEEHTSLSQQNSDQEYGDEVEAHDEEHDEGMGQEEEIAFDAVAMDEGQMDNALIAAPANEEQSADSNDALVFQEFDEHSQEKTMLSGEKSVAILKITKGEKIGREIKLQHGFEWTVGRGKGSDIVVDSAKLSRQHFKIVKIGNGYRIQDLGSSNGSRLNGVSITDAPLQVYDTIKAGPVELQFIIVDKSLHQTMIPAPPTPALESFEEGTHAGVHNAEEFNAPVPFGLEGDDYQKVEINDEFTKSRIETSDTKFNDLKKKKSPFIWWKKQPKKRKILWGSSLCILLLIFALALTPTSSKKREIAQNKPTEKSTAIDENAAIPTEVSSDFNLKTPEEKEEISKLYIEADKARRNRNWSKAYEHSSKILEKVDKYKDTNDIMSSALLFLNEQDISTFQKKGNELLTAEQENKQKVQKLVKSGEEALNDGRWKDAEIAFTNATILDPSNSKANTGILAAKVQDVGSYFNDAPQVELPSVDPFEELKNKEREEIALFNKEYQAAKQQLQEGAFREAFPVLKELKGNLDQKIDSFVDSDRMPASVAQNFKNESRILKERVIEAIDVANDQYIMEYKSQLDDAKQAINNKRYSEAKSIYDNIISKENYFEAPIREREKLYSIIISQAKNIYQEGLIYESVGDVDNAVDSFEKSKKLLNNIAHDTAVEYHSKSDDKLSRLKQ